MAQLILECHRGVCVVTTGLSQVSPHIIRESMLAVYHLLCPQTTTNGNKRVYHQLLPVPRVAGAPEKPLGWRVAGAIATQ